MLEPYPYVWRVRTRLPERQGQPCQVQVRGKMNSCLVVFADGFRVVTSRNYVRKRAAAETNGRVRAVVVPATESPMRDKSTSG